MIDVVSGSLSRDRDWAQVWLESPTRQKRMEELEQLKSSSGEKPSQTDEYEYASTFWAQTKIVCERASAQVRIQLGARLIV